MAIYVPGEYKNTTANGDGTYTCTINTALTVEANLALALGNYEGVEDVEFETVWGQGHTTAERSGNSTDNFIAWVNESVSE